MKSSKSARQSAAWQPTLDTPENVPGIEKLNELNELTESTHLEAGALRRHVR